MEIILRPQVSPDQRQPQDVYACDKLVGYVKPEKYSTGEDYWQAGFKLPGNWHSLGFIQGFGPTPEAAIADAIRCGIADAELQLSETKSLARSMGIQLEGLIARKEH